MMNNVPADVVRAMGARTRRRRQRRRSVGSRRDQSVAVRRRRGVAGRDDARQHQADDQAGRHHHRRAARRVRIARLAAQQGADRRGLQGRGGDARPAAAARGLGGRVREVAGGAQRSPPHHAAGRRRSSRVEGFSSSDERQLTALLARHIGADFDAEAFQIDVAVLSGLDRYESITWRFVKNAAGENGMLVAGAAQALRPAVHDAGSQPREHHLRGFPRHVHRPIPGVRRAWLRLGTAHRRHARIGSRTGLHAITVRSAARRCSSSHTPAWSIAPST